MADNLPGIDPAPVWPSWFFVGKNTPRFQGHNVSRGLHPLGFDLHADATLRCRGCDHVRKHSQANSWLKCALAKEGGPATDLRLRWRACAGYAPKEQA